MVSFRSAALVLAVLVRAAAAGHAQEWPAAPAESPGEGPDPARALWLSLGATVVPFVAGTAADAPALSGLGVLVGPAVGHWYAGRVERGFTGVVARLGVMTVGGLAIVLACTSRGCNDVGDIVSPEVVTAVVATTLGLAACVVYDIAKAPQSARAARRERAARVGLVPFAAPRSGAGLAVRLTL